MTGIVKVAENGLLLSKLKAADFWLLTKRLNFELAMTKLLKTMAYYAARCE
jgi:hypothetical protein